MPIAEAVLAAIAKAVFGYLLQQVNISDHVRRLLNREPKQLAFQRALGKALEQLKREHPKWTSALFDASFFEKEGAPVLAQFMIRDGHPDPSELAARWADSLNIRQPERRTTLTRELEPVAADFLDNLAKALKVEPELDDLNDRRALEQLTSDLYAIRNRLGAEQATPGTRRDYLRWLIGRNLYLDPRGTFQTQRQVQVKLEDIYVSLQAQREETLGTSEEQLLEQELAKFEAEIARSGLPAEEVEDQREQILARFKNRDPKAFREIPREVLELAEVVNRHERLVILGDPGSGKSTLLRYLALKHAQALQDGRAEAAAELGEALFPILIRIADYAENEVWKEKSLTDFLANACIVQECPKTGLVDLLITELSGGNCLVLLDGLDEIVNAEDRQGVVRRIEDFVRRHEHLPNRFAVTSHIAGYWSAPLSGPFTHYTVQEMDDSQIRRFLELWCLAVETAEMPEAPLEEYERKARQEINSILEAVQTSPGVRRLAANPLLLRTLALIHRTGAQLPQKRIELYKLAADTLGRTWQIARRLPASALVQDEYLTRLLRGLAYWLHDTKDSGIATEREVYDVLGKEWAGIKRLEWDPDDPDPDIVEEVRRFLVRVNVHTGLFVERSPKRYGFMHLTFEEYYAARNLVAKPRKAPRLIRGHLHDPRWDEPILLALGFVGLDFPEQAIELLETAVLAQGEEAEELGFAPSSYEDILGRDYLFALRCLGDQIPADPILVKQLMRRLADELSRRTGSGRFQRYRQALEIRLEHLKGSLGVAELIAPLTDGLSDADESVRRAGAESLVRLGQASPEAVGVLREALGSDDESVRFRVVASLAKLGQTSPEAVGVLREALGSDDWGVRIAAAESLVRLGQSPSEAVGALREALGSDDERVRFQAVMSLAELGQASPEAVGALLLKEVRHAESWRIRHDYADLLGQIGRYDEQTVDVLLMGLTDDDNDVRAACAQALARLGRHSPQASEAIASTLIQAIEDPKFDSVDSYEGRTGHDYAFDSLWMLIVGEQG